MPDRRSRIVGHVCMFDHLWALDNMEGPGPQLWYTGSTRARSHMKEDRSHEALYTIWWSGCP